MKRSVTWVTIASSAPMGQQLHEAHLFRALQETVNGDWQVSVKEVGGPSLRLPLGRLASVPRLAAAAVGSVAYGRAGLVHRLDLRLPPRLGREVVTVHDLPPLRFGDEGSLPGWAASSARHALGVICPSRFAAEEVAALLGVRRIWVVPNGVEANGVPEARPPGVEGRFVLCAGGATDRKNLAGLAGAWRRVARDAPDVVLVLCGPPDGRRDRLFASVPNVLVLGHLPHRRVRGFMRAAAAVVVPSLYEGFGLPALEGMAAGAPVVASDRGALPEVCGDAALLVEPTADGLAEGLLAVLRDGDRLREAGPARAAAFTWERAAEQTLAAYEEALA